MLLNRFSGQVTAEIDAPADRVFAALTDVPRLPDWNARIDRVLEPPTGAMAPGVQWVVRMRIPAPPASWPSRATCTSYDAQQRVFGHRSVSDDGNPSHADWRWQVAPLGEERARVDVAWVGSPRTFWRRLLFARMRRAQLRHEAAASLARLPEVLAGATVVRPGES